LLIKDEIDDEIKEILQEMIGGSGAKRSPKI
jgi:hypothetical protein